MQLEVHINKTSQVWIFRALLSPNSAPEESYTHRIMQVYVNICKVWVICSLIIPMFAGFYVLRNHATLLTKQYVKNLRR